VLCHNRYWCIDFVVTWLKRWVMGHAYWVMSLFVWVSGSWVTACDPLPALPRHRDLSANIFETIKTSGKRFLTTKYPLHNS